MLFGSPGTLVENNTIWVETVRCQRRDPNIITNCIPAIQQTLLGGINMVDYNPWNGNYTGTIVQNNTILGGFATDTPSASNDSLGDNKDDVIIKFVCTTLFA